MKNPSEGVPGKKKNPHEGHRQRRRSTYIEKGLNSFSSHEALEVLLFYAAPRVNTNELAHRLLDHFKTLDNIFHASTEELMSVPGVGAATASLLRFVPHYCRQCLERTTPQYDPICNYQDAAALLFRSFNPLESEKFLILCLDKNRRFLACHTICDMQKGKKSFHIRDVIRFVLSHSTASVYLAHTNPESLSMSAELQVVHKLRSVLQSLGITLGDYLILTGDNALSLLDNKAFQYESM